MWVSVYKFWPVDNAYPNDRLKNLISWTIMWPRFWTSDEVVRVLSIPKDNNDANRTMYPQNVAIIIIIQSLCHNAFTRSASIHPPNGRPKILHSMIINQSSSTVSQHMWIFLANGIHYFTSVSTATLSGESVARALRHHGFTHCNSITSYHIIS